MKVSEIRTLLRTAGRSQRDLAEHLRLSKTHVSQLLSGKRRMNVDTMEKISAFLANDNARAPNSVREYVVPFVTLEEVLSGRAKAPPLTEDEKDLIFREIRELGKAAKHLPRVTDMTDDEILGYDE